MVRSLEEVLKADIEGCKGPKVTIPDRIDHLSTPDIWSFMVFLPKDGPGARRLVTSPRQLQTPEWVLYCPLS